MNIPQACLKFDSCMALVPDLGGLSGMHVMLIVGLGILIFLSLIYIGGPLLVLNMMQFNENPEITSFDPNKIPAPLDASLDFFENQQQLLEKLGFEYVTNVFIRGLVTDSKMLGQLWFDTQSCNGVMLIHSYVTKNGNVTLSSQSVVFSTSFSNGVVVETTNTKDFSTFPPRPRRILCSMFWVKDIEKVYQFHKAICQDVMLNATPMNKLDEKYNGDGIEWVREGLKEENKDNLNSGFIKETADGDSYRFTIIGGFIMTWKCLFPWKQLRLMKMKSNIHKRMRDLDVRLK